MDMHKANRTKGGRPAKTTSERDRQQDEARGRGDDVSPYIYLKKHDRRDLRESARS